MDDIYHTYDVEALLEFWRSESSNYKYIIPTTDPWDEQVYLSIHEWLIFMVNVGKHTSPMDPMGYETVE